MRKLLATAAAIAPLLAATGVQAEVVISANRTTPLTTSSQNDNVRFNGDGGVTLTSGTAVTIDSDDNLDLDSGSDITMDKSASGSTGILVEGGHTSNIIIGGVVAITDDITTYTDTDTDGDLDGPFASGNSRYGLRLDDGGPLTGNITVESTGSITVDGADSYGIRLQSNLIGDLNHFGVMSITGTDTYGIRTEGTITGDVTLRGSTSVRGEGATGVSVEGDVAGGFSLQGAVNTTGYRYTTRPTDTFIAHLDADDLLQGGSGVVIGANVAGGVILDAPPANLDDKDNDEDDDGLTDASEGTAAVTTVGGAPAIRIGAADRSITLGAVGTGTAAYGFVNKGNVTAAGIYDDVASTGVLIGGNAGQTVAIAGGVRNEGNIVSTAAEADTTVLHIGSGVTAPALINTGTISGVSSGADVSRATAVQIDAGSTVTSFTNAGSVTATAGYASTATALLDASGTLTSITNTKTLAASITPDAEEATTGKAVAIDVSANTTGVNIVQFGILTEVDEDETILDADEDGVQDSDEPVIVGAIRMGSGADTLDIRNGVVLSDMSFGAGQDRLIISGGALVTGAVTDSDGRLDIDVTDGTLYARQTTQTTISSLDVGADGSLLFLIDPASGDTPGFNVTGTANLADGAGLGVGFSSLIDTPERYTLVHADQLNVGTIDQGGVTENSPYLFVTSVGVDAAAGDLYVDVRRRTAKEASLIPVEAQAFNAIYAALEDNEDLRIAFLTQSNREDFINLYEQMLPDHSGGPLLSLASGVDAVTRALTGRNASAAPGQTSAWVQEINFYADKDKTDTYGFRSEGFGVAGGVERGTGLGAVGLTAAFTSSDLEDPEAEAEEVLSASLLEIGLYWRAQGQYWTTWARAAGGYATFNAQRKFVGEGVNLSNESDWHGFTLAAAGGASYERSFGKLTVRPEGYAEFFYLSEDARVEEGGGDGFDLSIDERTGHMFSATAAMNVGYSFGRDGWIRPEVRFGWRQNISVDPGQTIARFASGGSDFTLDPANIEGGGPIIGFRLNLGNELGMLSLTGDAEMIEDYVRYSLLLRASFRF